MYIRSKKKLYDSKAEKLYVHIWAGSLTRVALFLKNEQGYWKETPWEIGYATDEQLKAKDTLYIDGKLAKDFLFWRGMRVNPDTARLVYRQGHPKHIRKHHNRVGSETDRVS